MAGQDLIRNIKIGKWGIPSVRTVRELLDSDAAERRIRENNGTYSWMNKTLINEEVMRKQERQTLALLREYNKKERTDSVRKDELRCLTMLEQFHNKRDFASLTSLIDGGHLAHKGKINWDN